MSLGDNNIVSVYRMAENDDGHSEFGATPVYAGVTCSIMRMSPFRESALGLGARVLAYDMHIHQALLFLLGDQVIDRDSVKYDVFSSDVIRDVDTFTRVTLKREYEEPA